MFRIINYRNYMFIAWLITYFGNFDFGFLSLRFRDFLYNVLHLQGKMGKTKWKINKLLHNILKTSSQKKTKNEVTKMGWNANKYIIHIWLENKTVIEFFRENNCHISSLDQSSTFLRKRMFRIINWRQFPWKTNEKI